MDTLSFCYRIVESLYIKKNTYRLPKFRPRWPTESVEGVSVQPVQDHHHGSRGQRQAGRQSIKRPTLEKHTH